MYYMSFYTFIILLLPSPETKLQYLLLHILCMPVHVSTQEMPDGF
jgi:hypothetical protein